MMLNQALFLLLTTLGTGSVNAVRYPKKYPGKTINHEFFFCLRKRGNDGDMDGHASGSAGAEEKQIKNFQNLGYDIYAQGDFFPYKGGRAKTMITNSNQCNTVTQEWCKDGKIDYHPNEQNLPHPGDATEEGTYDKDCKFIPKKKVEDPTTYGDPHFKTWSGEQYDFHGGCDLVLLRNKDFAHGLGMNIHIRTSIRTWWSYIESAVVQIGDNTLEVMAGIGKSHYWINAGDKTELQTGDVTLGDYPVHFWCVNDHHTKARIDLGHGDAIAIETFKDFVRVNIKNKSNKAFNGSSGLLGAYPDGNKVGRDGETVFGDANEFGQEWQVLASERNLFHSAGVVEPPNKCVMPEDNKKSQKQRRLGEATITEEQAALACARVSEVDRDACIFDVLATNDMDMAGSY